MRATVLLLGLAVVACRTMPLPPPTGFLDRQITASGTVWPYTVYVPRGWTPSRRWPVILFLHGAGERGTDGLRATAIGLGNAIRFHPERIPAVVVFPQVPPDERWLGAPADVAIAALDESIDEFSGDRERVYLTGLSMGGYGAWHLALQHPDRFAALVPVCGGIVPAGSGTSVRQSPLTIAAADPYAFTAKALRHIPVWIFHGADDLVVLPSESRKMHEALLAVGAHVRYTEYPGVGHGSWERAYDEESLWAWLFAQRINPR